MRLLVAATIPKTFRLLVSPFAKYFAERGWAVDAMVARQGDHDDGLKDFHRVWHVDWHRNPMDFRNLLVAPAQVRRAVLTGQYDIMHVHTPVAGFVARYALSSVGRSGRPQIIYTAHGFHFHSGGGLLSNATFYTLEKAAGRWTDYLIVVNDEDEQAAVRGKFVPRHRVRRMNELGVDLTHFSGHGVSPNAIARLRSEMGMGGSDKLLTMVAEFIPRKRHADAIRAFARLSRTDTFLALVGDGPLLGEMKSFARSLGVEDRIIFTGFRSDVPSLMAASVATVLPSEREGYAKCVMESMSLGIPVIGANSRGIREQLGDGSGVLVAVGDVSSLADAMNFLLDNPQEARKMGENGRRKRDAVGIAVALSQREALYAEAVTRRSRAIAPGRISDRRKRV